MASLIHGHANPIILSAVIEQLYHGTAYTMGCLSEVEFAKHLCERIPSIDKIRFVNSGTEAVMGMLKVSRAFTGRSKIAKAEGTYHGTYDFAEVSQNANPSNWGDIDSPNSVPVAHGTPQGVLDDVVIFPFNDIKRTLAILDKHKDTLACVLIDPIPHRVGLIPATVEYIQAIYDWTRKNGALLCFDEVITFRVGYSGAQENYHIMPDLTSLGKIIGGGFPIGAFGGRAEIMDVMNPGGDKFLFPHSGTFSANPISTTAGLVAMELFDSDTVNNLNALVKIARNKVEEAIKDAGVPVCITGAGSMFRVHLRPTPPTTFREAYQDAETLKLVRQIIDHLYYEEEILVINTFTCVFSTSVTRTEVEIIADAFYRTFKKFKNQIIQLQKK